MTPLRWNTHVSLVVTALITGVIRPGREPQQSVSESRISSLLWPRTSDLSLTDTDQETSRSPTSSVKRLIQRRSLVRRPEKDQSETLKTTLKYGFARRHQVFLLGL